MKRLQYFLLTLITIGVGLFSRTRFIPELIYPYLGDFLYTLMFYFLFAFLFPKNAPKYHLMLSIGLCFLIEICQLNQSTMMLEIRSSWLGGMILGHEFLWTDLVSYSLGGLFGYWLDTKWIKR
ncbi:MAG: DUF2809 domain-containing protein [Bacteroidia bacterium]